MAPTARASYGQRLHLVVELITQTRLSAYGVGADTEIGVGEPVVMRPGAEKLTDYQLGLYATRDYEIDHGTPESIEDLTEHSLIFYVESLLRVEDLDLLTRITGDHQVAFGSTSVQVQMAATFAGAGIGLLPAFVGDREPTLRRVLPSEVAPVLELTACLAPKRLRRPAAATVLQAIRETVAERRHELMPEW